MNNADLFIIHTVTANFSTRFLAKCPRDVPSICWIDNSREKETVEKWKKETRQRYLNLNRTVADIAAQKSEYFVQKTEPKKIDVYHLGWYGTPEEYPITPVEKVKKIIQQMRSTKTFEIEFFECNSTSMYEVLRAKQKTEVTDEFSQKWELMMQRIVQIGENTRVQTALARKEREIKAESKKRLGTNSSFEEDEETIDLLAEFSL